MKTILHPEFAGLTKSQKKVVYYTTKNNNIFVEGVAGTGKTFLLKKLSLLTGKNVELYATSGIASINLGGYTISSSYGLKLGKYENTDQEIKDALYKVSKNYIKNTIIVIDEIGLLSTEQFRQIDIGLRARGNSKEFLGGFQVILAGDFRQMPSISWGDSLENSNYLKNFKKIELIENVRQKDDVPFFNILQKVRTEGIKKQSEDYISKNHNPEIKSGITIVATRQLMDELNSKILPPLGVEVKKYNCDLEDPDRLYNTITLWEGMPVIICKNNNSVGYYNGDTGIILKTYEDFVLVRLDRTGEEVFIDKTNSSYTKFIEEELEIKKIHKLESHRMVVELQDEASKSFIEFFQNERNNQYFPKDEEDNPMFIIMNSQINLAMDSKLGVQKIKITKKIEYSYMPILPANFLSIRRCQGLTLTKGILHESILNASKYNEKDAINIQYVALSRFEKIKQLNFKTNKNKLEIWI